MKVSEIETYINTLTHDELLDMYARVVIWKWPEEFGEVPDSFALARFLLTFIYNTLANKLSVYDRARAWWVYLLNKGDSEWISFWMTHRECLELIFGGEKKEKAVSYNVRGNG